VPQGFIDYTAPADSLKASAVMINANFTELYNGLDTLPTLDQKVYAVDHGAVFDNSTDDSAAIQAAHDEIVASGEPGTLVLPARSRAKLLSPLEWDMAHVFIEGNGTALDCSPITSGYSVKIGGSVNPPYNQAMQGASRVRFEGNARAGSVDAWRVEGVHPGTGAGPSHATFDRVSITNFGGGIRFYSHA
jgi:hypothetical protein